MATIVTRSGKGSPLTHAEVDSNFTNLNTDKLELSGGTMTGNLSFGDNDKAIFGAGSDLQIYHDGSGSFVDDQGTGGLILRGTNLFLRSSANENYLGAVADGSVTIYHDNAPKLETTSTGISVTGNATFADNGKAIFGAGSDLEIYHTGTTSYIRDTGTGDLQIFANDDVFIRGHSTNNYMARFAEEGAVTLYHNNAQKLATTSTGVDITGTLTSDGLTVDNKTGSPTWSGNGQDTIADFKIGSRLDEVNSGSFALSLPSVNTGFESAFVIDGTYASNLTTTNLRSRGVNYAGYAGDMSFFTTGGTTEYKRLNLASNGDISFYEDTGTTAKFFWDASAESLGIGTSSPSYPLDVEDSSSGFIKASFVSTGTTHSSIVFDNTGSSANSVRVGSNNNDFYVRTSATERLRIDSLGNVGIGTSSPTTFSGYTTVHHKNTSGDAIYLIESDGGIIGQTFVNDASGVVTTGSRSNHPWRVTTNEVERMRIDSSGRVGIGTSSPNSPLEVSNGTENHRVAFGTGEVYLMARNASSYITQEYIANQHVFTGYGDNSSNEAMRIDSSGNLLVGKTSDNWGATGVQVHGYGVVAASRNGHVINANRETTDGDIVRFQKDGTTVGSIGVNNSLTYITTNGGFGVGSGITFDSTGVLPTTRTGGVIDNAFNIGSSSYRFKDLYLSGGVYLGGTGSANKLDDYEEGTWDPTFLAVSGSFGSITYDAFTKGAYTRIGRVVYITGTIRTDAITVGTASTGVRVSGLPFTVAANDPVTSRNMLSPLALSDQTSFASDSPNRAEFTPEQTSFVLQKQSSISSNIALLVPSDLGTGANANRLAFSGFYFTDA